MVGRSLEFDRKIVGTKKRGLWCYKFLLYFSVISSFSMSCCLSTSDLFPGSIIELPNLEIFFPGSISPALFLYIRFHRLGEEADLSRE